MSPRRTSWPWFASLVLHALIGLAVLWAQWWQPKNVPQPALSVELWEGGGAPAAKTAAVEVEPVAPVEAPSPAPAPQPPAPPAEINLGRKPPKDTPPKPEPETPRPVHKPEPKPEPKPQPKPVPKTEAKPEPKPKANAKPAPDKMAKADAKPAKPAKPAGRASQEADDMLAELGQGSKGTGKDRVTQAGAKGQGVEGGAVNGSANLAAYQNRVVQKVRPLVQVPDDLSGNPSVELRVALLPSLEVRGVQVIKSSGNAAYDAAVQRAVKEARTFPSLMPGMAFDDVRTVRLVFRPH
ncbi:energy transducer TonB [Crenobacter cavernae]|uniref:TonB C-terminal domain-containing protein n=1 Tax=Crenobacter cavernae TaxID=2290923 RepID=A0A345Y415_9NEIS|nr:energy transducer TonB [Crenobacter cavernae]AXK38667.1 TonB C-terminal domain-containing protein [Crenobacter cavernae]